jgi:cell wall assembly regulator SMI1
MTEIWKTIDRWLAEHAPELARDLLPGVGARDITKAEQELALTFPPDFKKSLAIHNGQLGGVTPLLGDWQLLPLNVIVRKWKVLHGVVSVDKNKKIPLSAAEKTAWWNDKWIPFAGNNAGDHLCIDLSGEPGTKKGRVISYWHMKEDRNTIAASYNDLLASFAKDLTANQYKYQDRALIKVK